MVRTRAMVARAGAKWQEKIQAIMAINRAKRAQAAEPVLAIDIETHGWRGKSYRPTEAEKEMERQLRKKQTDLTCNTTTETPCATCTRHSLTEPLGQFGFPTINKPWELTYSRVVQLGWAKYDREGKLVERRELCVSDVPGGCTPQATAYHGITNAQLEHGVPIAAALTDLSAALRTLEAEGGRLVAHNLEFDAGILHAEFDRLGGDFVAGKDLLARLAKDGCCTLERSQLLDNCRKYRSLDWACGFYGIETSTVDETGKRKRHTAEYDADCAAQLYLGMNKTRRLEGGALMLPLSVPQTRQPDVAATVTLE